MIDYFVITMSDVKGAKVFTVSKTIALILATLPDELLMLVPNVMLVPIAGFA